MIKKGVLVVNENAWWVHASRHFVPIHNSLKSDSPNFRLLIYHVFRVQNGSMRWDCWHKKIKSQTRVPRFPFFRIIVVVFVFFVVSVHSKRGFVFCDHWTFFTCGNSARKLGSHVLLPTLSTRMNQKIAQTRGFLIFYLLCVRIARMLHLPNRSFLGFHQAFICFQECFRFCPEMAFEPSF